MAKRTRCPNPNSREFILLTQETNGNKQEALRIWEENNFEYPDHIIAMVEQELSMDNNEEKYSVDPYLKKKTDLTKKARAVIKKKLLKVSQEVKKDPNQEKYKAEFKEILNDLDELESEAALHSFILAADRMANTASKWMREIKNGEKEATMTNLQKMQDYVSSFRLLRELREEYFQDEDHKKDFQIIEKIIASQNAIRNDYLEIARQKITEQWAPHFAGIEAYYRTKAEKEFITNVRPDLIKKGKTSAEIAKGKSEFVSTYMANHALRIQFETEDYVYKMLTQTTDISYMTGMLINPKDMNNDIMSMVVETLDKADFEIAKAHERKVKEANKLHAAFVKEVGVKNNPKEQYASILRYPEQDPGKDPMPYIIMSTDKDFGEFTKKYQGTAVWELQQFLEELAVEKDKLVFNSQKLGGKLPSINKQTFERLAANGVITTTKEGILDQFRLRAEDTDFGNIEGRLKQLEDAHSVEVSTNEGGKERESVPLHYRGEVSEKELSYDVVSSMLLDYHNSMNYKTKLETGAFLEGLKEVIGAADINSKTDFRKKILKEKSTGEAATTKGGEASNLYGALESIIRHRVYGIRIEGDPEVAKLIKGVAKYTSLLGLAANHLSGAANLVHGTVMSWIEAAGNKGGAFSAKDRAKAALKYDKDLHNIVNDISQRVPQSRTNLLVELFNAHSEFQPLDKKFVENNRVKRMTNTGTLMAFNTMGEHAVQSVVMYSVLNNIKVKDINGNYINKKGEVVENREEAMSVDEALVKNEKGILVPVENAASTEITDGLTDSDFFIISRKIRRITRDLYGNYDSENKSRLKRHAVGALAYQMRGWLLPGIQKRWRGIGTITDSTEDLLADPELFLRKKSVNQETGEVEEGTYTTTFRFLYGMRQDLKALKIASIPENWHQLTDQEKANIRKAAIEATVAALLFLLVIPALGESDEPEMVYATFIARRLYSELSSFINPKEAVRTFRSPMVAVSSAESAVDLIFQLASPLERYETGKRKGELKLKRRLIKLVPIWKQLDREVEEALIFLQR